MKVCRAQFLDDCGRLVTSATGDVARRAYEAASDERTHPDLNTVAYLAIGAKTALQRARVSHPELLDAAIEKYGGEYQLISDVVHHALLLDLTADAAGNDFDGVFDYEVAEAFGAEYAAAAIYGRPFDASGRAHALVADITYNKGDQP